MFWTLIHCYTQNATTFFIHDCFVLVGTLAALVYQHTITPLALPCKLLLPDPGESVDGLDAQHSPANNSQLLQQGAGKWILYLHVYAGGGGGGRIRIRPVG